MLHWFRVTAGPRWQRPTDSDCHHAQRTVVASWWHLADMETYGECAAGIPSSDISTRKTLSCLTIGRSFSESIRGILKEHKTLAGQGFHWWDALHEVALGSSESSRKDERIFRVIANHDFPLSIMHPGPLIDLLHPQQPYFFSWYKFFTQAQSMIRVLLQLFHFVCHFSAQNGTLLPPSHPYHFSFSWHICSTKSTWVLGIWW